VMGKYANVCDLTTKEYLHPSPAIGYRREFRDGYATIAPVARLSPNAFGLYDMIGNLWEWCRDYYKFDYYITSPCRDPEGPRKGTDRVDRGGSWINHRIAFLRSADRYAAPPTRRCYNLGARLVLVEPE